MPKKSDQEKEAAKARYNELLTALAVINSTHKDIQFEIMPNPSLFRKLEQNEVVTPLNIEFKSKNTGATFSLENKFFPHSWMMTIPEQATKEERNCMRDLILETIAHPMNAHKEYHPQMLTFFPEETPEEEIFEFIDAAEAKGIKVNLFIGNLSDFKKLNEEHSQKTKELIAEGKLDDLPGWDGMLRSMKDNAGGQKGEEVMERYKSENKSSMSMQAKM